MKNRKICNGQGICRYDTSQQSARCFCSDGFEGDDCGNVVVARGSGRGAGRGAGGAACARRECPPLAWS